MNTITHALVSYDIASGFFHTRRERVAVTLSGILPDLDGLGAPLEILFKDKFPVYSLIHHTFGHTLWAALFLSLGVYLWCGRRLRAALAAFGVVHLHFLCDLLGSGGPDGSNWGIPYLWPIPDSTVEWSGQWALNAWPNIALTMAALAWLFFVAWKRGYSILEMGSIRADRVFVQTLRNRFGEP
ncbi:MAG TPA: metal-dependent hydrolase [Thermoanaerobaculia bacterium]|nr:metal-dependent hydrolase [Thermoanaerobaculia bacterium]HUM29184.1 metal-dependent hydrolase [Thermoanaerobaculia bacterium]HXK67562.1 metal-dependent hydrolase [Thermoanaerobaculia bacterium]